MTVNLLSVQGARPVVVNEEFGQDSAWQVDLRARSTRRMSGFGDAMAGLLRIHMPAITPVVRAGASDHRARCTIITRRSRRDSDSNRRVAMPDAYETAPSSSEIVGRVEATHGDGR